MPSRILFVNQPAALENIRGPTGTVVNRTAPLTLCLLASIARKHGYGVSLLDAANSGLSMEETVARIVEDPPAYLAFYATTQTVVEAGRLASEVKRSCPETVVIAGGVPSTYCPEQTMEAHPGFDIGVIGEGDRTFPELLGALDERKSLAHVKGIIFRSTAGLVRTAVREPLEELDALPMPAFDLLEGFPDAHLPPPFLGFSSLPTATAVVSRGCPGGCLFCSSGIFGHKQLRMHHAKYIVELMRHLQRRYGVRQVQFYDDNFCTSGAAIHELCDRMITSGLGMTWSCNTRVTDVAPALLASMKQAGCWKITYGIESGSQRLLNLMRKGITLDGIERAIQWTRQAGILAYGCFFFGYPGETDKEMEETMDFALSLGLDLFECNAFMPRPTLLFPQGFGLRDSSVPGRGGTGMETILTDSLQPPEGDSADRLDAHVRRAWRRFYCRPSVQFRLFRMLLQNRMIGHYLRIAVLFVRFLLYPPKRDHPER